MTEVMPLTFKKGTVMQKVSVIVPVYNVRPYLAEALESIISQSYRDLEILVIDDGSDDGSAEICENYAEADSRIRLFRQNNQGLSGARNTGLRAASGQLIMFLDPDDAFAPEAVRTLVEALNKSEADMAVGRYFSYQTTERMDSAKPSPWTRRPLGKSGLYTRKQALKALTHGDLNISVWNKVYRRKLWDDLFYPEGHVYEDIDTTFRILDRCERICLIDETVYLNRKRPGSITATCNEKNIKDSLRASDHYENFVRENIPGVFDEKDLQAVEQSRFISLMSLYLHYCGQGGNDRELKNELRSRIRKLSSSHAGELDEFRLRLGYAVITYCPWLIRAGYPLYRLWHRMKYR